MLRVRRRRKTTWDRVAARPDQPSSRGRGGDNLLRLVSTHSRIRPKGSTRRLPERNDKLPLREEKTG